jgi:hypothetical protein
VQQTNRKREGFCIARCTVRLMKQGARRGKWCSGNTLSMKREGSGYRIRLDLALAVRV